jgi:hypothetical protein
MKKKTTNRARKKQRKIKDKEQREKTSRKNKN